MDRYNRFVFEELYQIVERYPDKSALVYLGQKFSFKRLKEFIDRFSTALYDIGLRANDKFMIYLPNCPQFLIAYLGAQRIGAIPVPVSPIYTPHEIRYLLKDSNAESILCLDINFRYVKEVFDDTPLKRVIITTYVDMLPAYKRIFGYLMDKIPKGKIEKGRYIFLFKKLINDYSPSPPPLKEDPGRLLSYILYTGGTTGFPKGCISTHKGMVSFLMEIRDCGKGIIKEGKERLIMINPLFHQMAQGMTFGMGFYKANTVILMPIPQVDAILKTIERHKVTLFLGAPTLYRMILENDRLDFFDLSSLRFCWSGGDVLPLEVFRRWKERFNIPIYQVYGATEVGFTCMSPLDREPIAGSIGTPLASRDIMIVNPETLSPVKEGEAGELLVSSDYITPQYWNKPEETAASYIELNGKIWYRMRDFVRKDKDGLLYYVDRSADIIKYKAYRVSCSEIEAVLQDHPAVIGACVVGVPDEKVGERIKAIVVLKEDIRGVSGGELIKWCKERLAPYKVPQYIEFRDMLPKSKVGKLLRREVREEERRKIAKQTKKISV
ncbi:MAG TPA: AMP-dependent synthetase [Desulfobacteraceae bacterium]|nr:AMP-dependent synthetase [Desulfobacteraceae bacterium]